MTNRDKWGYQPIPLCDGHFHITFAHPVETTVKILSDTMTWSSSGYCGKKQPMPVAMGGPAIRCKVNIGGR